MAGHDSRVRLSCDAKAQDPRGAGAAALVLRPVRPPVAAVRVRLGDPPRFALAGGARPGRDHRAAGAVEFDCL
ncbi:hypothetical protein ACFC8N_35650 [Streptomyces sp. NPDC055966]|uniref:hypothetical protein n=1 Tax=unclassified Streptomyces TaxID=2593676 RepID=UPI0035D6C08E